MLFHQWIQGESIEPHLTGIDGVTGRLRIEENFLTFIKGFYQKPTRSMHNIKHIFIYCKVVTEHKGS
jgi:hypothetical protein